VQRRFSALSCECHRWPLFRNNGMATIGEKSEWNLNFTVAIL